MGSSEGSIKVPILTEPEGRLYAREVSTHEFVTKSPTLPDPYELSTVEVKKSNVFGANDGLFARKKIEKNVVVAFYKNRLTKMKSNSYTGVKLDQFKDIKVGPYQSEVVYGSPSYEPYPDLDKEEIIYKGGRDRQRKFHGKGTVEFEEDGSFMSGVWEHGIKQGLFKI